LPKSDKLKCWFGGNLRDVYFSCIEYKQFRCWKVNIWPIFATFYLLQGTRLRLQIGQFDNKKFILLFSLFDCWFYKNFILHFNIDIEANIRGKMTVFQKKRKDEKRIELLSSICRQQWTVGSRRTIEDIFCRWHLCKVQPFLNWVLSRKYLLTGMYNVHIKQVNLFCFFIWPF
jgi:hypothetical protein